MTEYSIESGEPIADVDEASPGPSPTALPAAPPESEYLNLALDCIVPGLYQPRKRFSADKMAELVASIAADDVHEPILVRPLPGSRLQDSFQDRRPGQKLPTHELISGERRWRASKSAGKATIPARCKRYTDEQVVRIQMVENVQREDLHPMEEAEGYAHMMEVLHINADQVADEVGTSRATVYARMKLLDLCETARTAFYAEQIDQSRALVIARIPDEALQLKALAEATKADWQGSVPNFRAFQRWVQQNLMLRLDAARFKITDITLVPDAGSCKDCPKRTGAAPTLFDDVDSPDVCTDPKCFHAKQAAHDETQLNQAKAKGQTIITGTAAKRVWEYEHSSSLKGYKRLDRPDSRVDSKKTLKKMLGKDCPEPTMLQSPFDGSLIPVIDDATVNELLKDRGLITPSQARASREISAHEAKAKAEEKYQRTWRKLAIEKIFEVVACNPSDAFDVPIIRLLAKMMLQGLVGDDRAHTAQLLGVGKVADAEGIKAYIDASTAAVADSALLLLLMQHDMHFNEYAGIKDPLRIMAVADAYQVDLQAVQDEVKTAMKAAIKKPLKSPLPLASAAQADGGGGAKAQSQNTKSPAAPARKKKMSADEAQAAIAAAMQGQDTDTGAASATQGIEAVSGCALPVGTPAPEADAVDPTLYGQALDLITHEQKASVRRLKAELGIGTDKAMDLMDALEKNGKVSACDERGARKVLVTA